MDASVGDLAFLPLGGTGEIGMNLNLYRYAGKYLAVDCGIGFGGNELPEAEIIMPDPAFIAERRDKLVGLVITHAHEDHIGAGAHLWRQLRCPVYATPFTAAVLRRKLGEAQLLNEVKIHVIPPGGTFEVAPFALQFLRVAHSTPEAQGLAIRTPAGLVVHTGDWKLDPHPLVGPPTDEAAFQALGDEGVLAMVCDSTNALVEGHSGSEADVRRSLSALIGDLRGRVVVTCFASNVARVESIALAARAAGRSVALVGPPPPNLARPPPRNRLPRHPAALHLGRPRRGRAGRQPPHPHHRQPGRTAQRARPRGVGHAPEPVAGGGGYGHLLQPHDPRQRTRHRHRAG